MKEDEVWKGAGQKTTTSERAPPGMPFRPRTPRSRARKLWSPREIGLLRKLYDPSKSLKDNARQMAKDFGGRSERALPAALGRHVLGYWEAGRYIGVTGRKGVVQAVAAPQVKREGALHAMLDVLEKAKDNIHAWPGAMARTRQAVDLLYGDLERSRAAIERARAAVQLASTREAEALMVKMEEAEQQLRRERQVDRELKKLD